MEPAGELREPSSASLLAGRPEAAAAIWRWREPAAAAGPSAAALRREGLLRAVVGGLVAGGLSFFHHPRLALVAAVLSGLVALAALASPRGAYAALGKGLAAFGKLVGRFLAVLLLTPVFLLFFTLVGRIMRRGRRDKLERWFDDSTPSYWHQRPQVARTEAYYRHQF